MNMKHLLMLSYFFPPHGGGGVLRPLQTARLLVDHGWRTTVVAGPESGWWLRDEGLLDGLPEEVDILRTRALSGPGLLRAFRRGSRRQHGIVTGRSERTVRLFRGLADWLGVPDVYCGWIPFAVRAAIKVAGSADCILSTSPAESAHLAARSVARTVKKPWVADFRDPWFRGIYRHYPTGLHESIQQRSERRVVAEASAVIANTEAALDDFHSRYPDLPADKFLVIPNGFDPQEFDRFQEDRKKPGPLKIIHAGGLTLDRDPTVVFEALAALKAESPNGPPCRLEMVGLCDKSFREKAGTLGVDDLVGFTGPLPRAEVLDRLAGADAGLVLESFRRGAELVVPGKTYDYLGAGLAVLAVVPEGAAARLVRETGCGSVVTRKSVGAVKDALKKLLSRHAESESPAGPRNTDAVRQYERPRLVNRLAGLLNKLAV